MNKGTLIVDVSSGSIPWEIGIRAGDRIVSVDGKTVDDSLTAMYLLSDDYSALVEVYSKQAGRLLVTIDDASDFLAALEFEPLRIMHCKNNCIYCFCKQNPPHARPSFSLRDEDFRLSFLAGYYTTMSTISDEELVRIVEHQLTPQYVTVPSTDEKLRRLILGRDDARPILETLRFFVDHGITVHIQTVVCPGFNDGRDLEKTIENLAALGNHISSVVLVPVGLTRFTRDSRLRRLNEGELSRLLRLVWRWRHRTMPNGHRWLEASDEVYLALNRMVPAARSYGSYPQISSGVGMTRQFKDDIRTVERRRRPEWWSRADVLLVSGMLFGPLLTRWSNRLNRKWGRGVRTCIASNGFFGPQVTVAGLLSGTDVMSALKNGELPDILILSDDILDPSGRCFVDDMTVDELKEQTGIPVIAFAHTMGDAFETIRDAVG